MLYIAIILFWVAIGASGFIFWWTKDHDYTTKEVPLMLFASTVGVFSWFIGWVIHGKLNYGSSGKTLIKKRTKNATN